MGHSVNSDGIRSPLTGALNAGHRWVWKFQAFRPLIVTRPVTLVRLNVVDGVSISLAVTCHQQRERRRTCDIHGCASDRILATSVHRAVWTKVWRKPHERRSVFAELITTR